MTIEAFGHRAPVIAASAVLLLAAAASILALPAIDEFCFAGQPPLQAANNLFYDWSGRWLGMFALAALTPDTWQPLVTLIAFPIWFAGFYAIAATVHGKPLVPSLLMLAVFWAACPFPDEAFQFLAGIVMYAVPFALGSVAAWLLTRRSAWAIIPAAASVFFNELAGVVIVAGLIPFAVRDKLSAAVLVATFLAFLVVALSPGNAARSDVLNAAPVSPVALAYYVVRPYDTPWPLLFDFRLWAMAALFAFVPGQRDLPWLKIAAAALLAIVTATVAVTFAANMAPQGRVLDFLFAVIVAIIGAVALSCNVAGPKLVASLALAGGLITAPNVGNLLRGGWQDFQQREERVAAQIARLRATKQWECKAYFGFPSP